MKSINVKGTARTATGKKAAREIRKSGAVPCNLYGEAKNDKEQIQVSATLNADKSIHQLMVRRDDETITYTFNY